MISAKDFKHPLKPRYQHKVLGPNSWTLMHYGQYKQVALRQQAMLVTRGAFYRFGRVNKFADKEKDNVTIDN